MEDRWQTPGPGDLLIEGEEGEYFLELLMRRASPGKPKADLLAESKAQRIIIIAGYECC
jgi:hypothetical protein